MLTPWESLDKTITMISFLGAKGLLTHSLLQGKVVLHQAVSKSRESVPLDGITESNVADAGLESFVSDESHAEAKDVA